MIPGNLSALFAASKMGPELVFTISADTTMWDNNQQLINWLGSIVGEDCQIRIKVNSAVLLHAQPNFDTLYLPRFANGFTITKWTIENDGYIIGGGGTPRWDSYGNPGKAAIVIEPNNIVEIINRGVIAGGGGAGGTDDAARGKWGGGGAPNGGYGATTWAGGPAYQGGGMGGQGGAPGVAGHASYVNGSRYGGAAGAAIKVATGTATVIYTNEGDIRGVRV